jgi:histone-lysine N-methyltransferase SETMAR
MASVFWDAEGILFIDYLEKGKTITGEYYSSLLTKLRLHEKIREKRPGFKKKIIIFHQDNAPAHKSVLALGKLRDLHYELLEHPPYSPNLAPSDFYLSQNSNSSSLVSVFLRIKKRLQL